MQPVASTLWHRLDLPGHDACRLDRQGDAWQLDGTSLFRQTDGRIAQLHYRVRCDKNWHTQWGTVRGWMGGSAIDFSVSRGAHGEWKLNDVPAHDLAHCVDLDLGFTPATNLIQLRRLNLKPGEAADAPAAWLDVEDGGLTLLAQRYERRDNNSYWYQAPRFDYADLLHVTSEGFVREYPRLWMAER